MKRQRAHKRSSLSGSIPFRIYLPLLALAVEILFSRGSFPEWFVFSLEYGLLFWFVLSNLRGWGIGPYLIGAGTLLNFAVIVVNGFYMPVWPSYFEMFGKGEILNALLNGEVFGYTLAGAETKLPFLADVIGFSFYGDLVGFASIGDIFLMLGIIILLYRVVSGGRGC